MKTLLLSILLYGNNPKVDTIDFWHIYYNNLKVKELNITLQDLLLSIKISNVQKTDSLTIKYFRDTPCSDCETQATIEDDKQSVIVKGKNIGTFSPLKIPLFELLQNHIKTKKKIFHLFYHENGKGNEKLKVFLLKIQLE